MVDRYRCFGWDIRRGVMKLRGEGEWVLYSDYARLQEQVETLTKERDEAKQAAALEYIERNKALAIAREAMCENRKASEYLDRAEAAEAEQDRLREAIERVLSPAPGVRKPEPWVYGILKVALQKEPKP